MATIPPKLETTLDEAQLEALRPAQGRIAEINRIADQLCGVIEGDQGLQLWTESEDITMQKLCIAINFLLETVRRSVDEAEAKSAELARTLETVAGQRDQIRSLSTPLLRVHRDVLVLPLIGVLDDERCERISEALLHEISGGGARHAIIDVTGVAVVDSHAAHFLTRLANTVGLLGARCVLTGVSPAMAQTLVALGVDLGKLSVARDLEQGLALVRAATPP